jgi:hypothetical protein
MIEALQTGRKTMKLKCILFLLAILVPTALFSNTIYFPQVAYGGGYSTTFVIMNTGTGTVSSQLGFFSQTGAQVLCCAILSIPPGGSERYTLPNTGPLTVVWAVVTTSTSTVQGVATFDLRNSNGTLITTAGVLGIEAGNGFLLPVDVTSNASTGVAIANVYPTPNTSVNVSLRLLAEDGSQVATANDVRFAPLLSGHQVADFVTNIFPQLNGTTFKGALVVTTPSNAPANSLGATALTVKEGLLSALPVIPVTSSTGGTTGSTGAGTASVVFQESLSGGATLQFQGKTFSTDGLQTFTGIAPGTYQITGTIPFGGIVGFAFANGGGALGSGGVVPGSLKSLAGPSGVGTIVSACNVSYVNVVSSSQPYTLQFTVTTSTSAACQTGQ